MCCVEVRASEYARAVVALGDSITDGTMSTPSTNSRWPNFLAARLLNHLSHRDVAVLDQGIGGHAVLHEFLGPNALARFDRDVIAQTAVRHIILLEEINDIGIPDTDPEGISAGDIILAYKAVYRASTCEGD